ncbi:MAG TPA: hypothetical protein DDY37_04265, partial [Legionella sp.]|nr:hypothetical protein [Legionella sp.]
YYTQQQGQLITATSVAKLLRQLTIKPSFNQHYLARYFYRGIFHRQGNGTETIFKGIYHIPIGCTIEQNGQYIEVVDKQPLDSDTTLDGSLPDTVERFNHLLFQAISGCMPTEGHVAVELSGGLDSSAVSAMTRACRMHDPIIAFTNGTALTHHRPKNPSKKYLSHLHDESSFSRAVAHHLQLNQIIVNDHYHFHDVIEEYTEILGTMAEVTFPLLNHRCYELAQNMGVTALLSGFGGDEMVSPHANTRLHELRQQKAYARYYYETLASKRKDDWLKKLGLLPKSISRLAMPTEHLPFLRETDVWIEDEKKAYFPTVKSWEHALTKGDLSVHFNRRIVTSSIIAEHYGIKQHFPLTDPALMHFFHHLPSHLKRRHGKGRYLMRHAMHHRLPRKVVWRQDKSGATAPAAWNNYVQSLPKLFLDRISPDHQGISADYVNISKLTQAIEKKDPDGYTTGIIRLSLAVMMLAHLEKWLNELY